MTATNQNLRVFISFPYEYARSERLYWETFAHSVINISKEIKSVNLDVCYVKDDVNELNFKKVSKELIDSSDFIIAIVRDNSPNTFWEIGYSESKDKPVVYIVNDDSQSLKESSVFAVEALILSYRISDIQEGEKLSEKFSKKLFSFLIQAIRYVQSMPKQPLLTAYSNREGFNLPGLITNAQERIYLITTNLGYFSDPEGFTITDKKGSIYAFDPPVARGVDVKILTLDPESIILRYRAEQLGFDYDVGIYREELKRTSKRIYQRYRNQSNVSIRLYDDLPLQIALIIDSYVITSIITRGTRSRNNLHFLMDLSLPGAESFEKHFSEVAAGPGRHISSFKWAGTDPIGTTSHLRHKINPITDYPNNEKELSPYRPYDNINIIPS